MLRIEQLTYRIGGRLFDRASAAIVLSGWRTAAEMARLYKGSPDDLFKTAR